ncbi:MAG: hypothetical protein ACOY45_12800 [Pseudomonadota bacterium]
MRRIWKAATALGAAAAIAGCHLVTPAASEPDALAKWVREQGVIVDPPATVGDGKDGRVEATADGHGYRFVPAKESQGPAVDLYLVPVDSIDAGVDRALRQKIFPGGIATIGPKGGDDTQPKRSLAEADVERLYLQVLVVKDGALCADFTKPCDAAMPMMMVGKLRARPMMGKDGEALGLMVDAAPDAVVGAGGPDMQKLCGFDPRRDRVPMHVAMGCRNLGRMTWAADHGFTLSQNGDSLIPITPDALKRMIQAYAEGTFYKDGLLVGTLDKVK